MLQQIVIDVLYTLELPMRRLVGNEDTGVATIKTINIVDVAKVPHPFAYTQQVEAGRADKINGRLVAMEETPYFGDVLECLQVGSSKSNRAGAISRCR